MIRVYRYGLLAPIQNAELVREQMHLAHKYRNTLVQIERERRAAIREATSAHGEIAALEKAATDAAEHERAAAAAVSQARAEARSRKVAPELTEQLKVAREAHKAIKRALRERRDLLRKDLAVQVATDVINERAAEKQRAARGECGVFWGTYQLVDDAARASRAAPMYDGAEPNDPKFVRWDGNGAVGVQIQGGMPCAAVFGDDRQLRIDPVDERAWNSEARGERRRASRTTLHVRVDSDRRDPVWASWPMVMHRPLPDGGTIKRATVHVRRRGPREEWSVSIVVDMSDVRQFAVCGKGTVAVDLGWRMVHGGIRVATWHGADGQEGELVLDHAIIGGLRKVEDLESIRARACNEARATLARWLDGRQVPEWLREATATMAHWRSINRLAALARKWKAARFDGDETGYEPLEAWRYHDYHLWAWESSQRLKSLRRRREQYRVFAAALATQYETVVLEKFDLRKIARAQDVADDGHDNETSRSNRQLAAVSELRLTLKNAFEARGGAVAIVSARDSTRECHVCGHVEKFDAATYLHHRCSACGAHWDQDANAARVLLSRHCERQVDDTEPATARAAENKETRWARAARLRAEKLARKEAAREVGCNPA